MSCVVCTPGTWPRARRGAVLHTSHDTHDVTSHDTTVGMHRASRQRSEHSRGAVRRVYIADLSSLSISTVDTVSYEGSRAARGRARGSRVEGGRGVHATTRPRGAPVDATRRDETRLRVGSCRALLRLGVAWHELRSARGGADQRTSLHTGTATGLRSSRGTRGARNRKLNEKEGAHQLGL